MRDRHLEMLGFALLLFTVVFFAPLPAQETDGLPDTTAFVAKLRAKYAPIYRKYAGFETTRDFTTKTYDPATGKLLSTEHTVVRKKEYFYKAPESTVLLYEKDGKKLDPDDYDTTEIAPFWPLFDDKSDEHYDFRVSGEYFPGSHSMLQRPAIVLNVTPKKEDYRHFKGHAYVAPDTYELLMIEGGPAKPHWAMKDFSVKYLYESVAGGYCLKKAWVSARVSLFLIRPDRRHIYEVTGSDTKPIPK